MKKGEYVSMGNLKQTLPYLTVSLIILYIFMRIYKSYNPFAFPGIEERISLILVPCLFLTLIFYFPFHRIVNLLKVTLNILREKVSMPKPKIIQKGAQFKLFKLKFAKKFDIRKIISSENYQKALIKYLFLVFLVIIAFPFQRIVNLLKVTLNILREKVPKPTFIQKRAWFNVFKLKFAEKFDIRKIVSSENYQKALIKYLFLVFLVIIALLELEPISKYLSFLTNFKTHLLVLAIAFGVVTFWQNREVITKIEEETSEEEKQEQKRKAEFSKKFSRINRIPVFRNIVRWMYKEGWWYSVGLIICLILFLSFGLNHLGQFQNVDEPKWIGDGGRVDRLYEGIRIGDFEKTYINDKPGIIPSYLSGIFVANADRTDYDYKNVENYFFWARFPLIVFNAVMLIVIFILLSKVFDKTIALISTYSISVFPAIIGLSQIVNPNATLWSFSFISILSYFVFLKYRENRYLVIGGVFLGLASLSKYSANFIYYILFIFAIIYWANKTKNKSNLKSILINEYINIFKIWIIALSVVFLLFPATWVDPSLILKQTFLHSFVAPLMMLIAVLLVDIFALKGILVKKYQKYQDKVSMLVLLAFIIPLLITFINIFSNFSFFSPWTTIYYEISGFVPLLLMSFHSFIFSTPIIFLVLIVVFLIWNTKRKNLNPFIFSLLLVVVAFLFGAAFLNHSVGAIYSVLLFPLYLTIAGIGFNYILKKTPHQKIKIITIILFVILSISPVLNAMPFYHTYTNPLNYRNFLVTEAWGLGGYELAQQANELLPDNAIVWVDREGFAPFYKGKTYWRGNANPFNPELDVDYLVLTFGGERIFTKALDRWNEGKRYFYAREAANTPILEYYNKTPLYKVRHNNNPNNCMWIVKVNKSDLMKNETDWQ